MKAEHLKALLDARAAKRACVFVTDLESGDEAMLDALERGRSVYTSGRLYRYLMPILRTPLSRVLMRATGVQFRRPD